MNHRRITAAAVGALLVAGALGATTSPAFAGLPVTAHASIGVSFTSSSASVCYDGYVDDGTGSAGTWELQVEGARSDASPIRQTDIEFGESIGPACYPIPKNGAAAGHFTATLTFETIGSGGQNPVPDFTAFAVGGGFWDPDTNPGAASFGT